MIARPYGDDDNDGGAPGWGDMSGVYCTMLCEKDEECGEPGFTCGSAEVTTKGLITTSKQESRYCTKAAAPLYKPK